MANEEKKGITVKIDAALHAEVRQYLEDHGMTMAEFITLAIDAELHPKIIEQEEKTMEKMRTLAFQVNEELFQKVKDYLRRNNMSQKEFVIGLIEAEIDRDLAEREALRLQREAAVEQSDCSDEIDVETAEETDLTESEDAEEEEASVDEMINSEEETNFEEEISSDNEFKSDEECERDDYFDPEDEEPEEDEEEEITMSM